MQDVVSRGDASCPFKKESYAPIARSGFNVGQEPPRGPAHQGCLPAKGWSWTAGLVGKLPARVCSRPFSCASPAPATFPQSPLIVSRGHAVQQDRTSRAKRLQQQEPAPPNHTQAQDAVRPGEALLPSLQEAVGSEQLWFSHRSWPCLLEGDKSSGLYPRRTPVPHVPYQPELGTMA